MAVYIFAAAYAVCMQIYVVKPSAILRIVRVIGGQSLLSWVGYPTCRPPSPLPLYSPQPLSSALSVLPVTPLLACVLCHSGCVQVHFVLPCLLLSLYSLRFRLELSLVMLHFVDATKGKWNVAGSGAQRYRTVYLDDEIIEDVVGDVKYTDSMKSILTRSAYTDDFTDSSPERYNSSGKETYVIDDDSDDSRVTYDTTAGASEALQPDGAASSATGDDLKSATRERIVGPFAKRLQMCSLTTHEIFTQTSRTIIEIAEVEGLMQVSDVKTQTSFITITENKTVQYKVEDTLNRFNAADPAIDFAANDGENVSIVSKYEGDGLKQCLDRASPAGRSALTDEGVKGTDETETDDVSSASECDIEEDSLMSDSDKAEGKASVNDDAGEANGDDTDKTRSEDGEMGELYAKLIGTIDVHLAPERHNLELSNLSTMTPLTEESKHSLINITPRKLAPTPRETRLLDDLNEKIKSKRKREDERSGGSFELPHVHRRGAHCGSPRLSILFSVDPRGRDFDETEALPQLIRTRGDRKLCNSLQVGRTKSDKAGSVQLPPIHSTFEGHNIATTCRVLDRTRKQRNHQNTSSSTSICIRKRINELKYSSLRKRGQDVVGYPGTKKDAALGRMYSVHPSQSECFYLRILLQHTGLPSSNQNLVEVIPCRTSDVNELSVFVNFNIPKLVADQKIAFDAIIESVESNTGRLFFLDAPGGTDSLSRHRTSYGKKFRLALFEGERLTGKQINKMIMEKVPASQRARARQRNTVAQTHTMPWRSAAATPYAHTFCNACAPNLGPLFDLELLKLPNILIPGTSSGIADSHIHQGARSVKTTDTTSLSGPLSCNGQRVTKTFLRQPQNTTDRLRGEADSRISGGLHAACCRQASTMDFRELTPHTIQNCRLEVREALQELPGAPRAAWRRAGERAVAALVRQVVTQVESPRPAVACGACAALAAVLKNTNYTKKPVIISYIFFKYLLARHSPNTSGFPPATSSAWLSRSRVNPFPPALRSPDFYEAVTCLLSKTGSRSRPVRRAANRALDEVVCGVDLHHALAALCLHGVGHKSALVRCAFARLVVVCAALAGAGRGLLRARPAAAAAARRHVLRALAALLNDRYNDTRLFTAHAGFGSPISMPEGCDISSNVDRPHAVVLMAYDLLYGQFLGPNKEYNLNPLSKLLVMVPDGKRKPAALGRLTRKYAERLYAMLRPLKNFEAYYLTDVDVDVAVAHMKKYDKLLPAPATQRPAS
ncbi:hypothetical protein EVAR_9733_1 [Eumeta japonica]|uniref:Uncharacterized protein n=1 Tax=Eumeta variegata TaxID=151549 RepID=A0A4C1U5L6_EUMVA|nr:hypothetical protein EVAR_9733_1 [Eumeta japonica]